MSDARRSLTKHLLFGYVLSQILSETELQKWKVNGNARSEDDEASWRYERETKAHLFLEQRRFVSVREVCGRIKGSLFAWSV